MRGEKQVQGCSVARHDLQRVHSRLHTAKRIVIITTQLCLPAEFRQS